MNTKTPRLVACLPLLLALMICLPAGAAPTDDSALDPPHEFNRGFQLGLGWYVCDVDPGLDGQQSVPAAEAGYDARGRGVELVAGWGFGPNFRTEFGFAFAAHDEDSEIYDVYSGSFRFDGVFSLLPDRRLQPELIAGMGWGGLVYTDADEPDYLYGWLQGNMGAGLRWRLGEHWTLNGQYVFSLLNVEREYINDDDEQTNYIEGDGRLHRLSLRMIYDF